MMHIQQLALYFLVVQRHIYSHVLILVKTSHARKEILLLWCLKVQFVIFGTGKPEKQTLANGNYPSTTLNMLSLFSQKHKDHTVEMMLDDTLALDVFRWSIRLMLHQNTLLIITFLWSTSAELKSVKTTYCTSAGIHSFLANRVCQGGMKFTEGDVYEPYKSCCGWRPTAVRSLILFQHTMLCFWIKNPIPLSTHRHILFNLFQASQIHVLSGNKEFISL